jgi:hypothetical protein
MSCGSYVGNVKSLADCGEDGVAKIRGSKLINLNAVYVVFRISLCWVVQVIRRALEFEPSNIERCLGSIIHTIHRKGHFPFM